MNKVRLVCASGLTLLAIACGSSAMASTSYEEAMVLASTPIYHTVEITTPRRECWEEQVARSEPRRSRGGSATPEIFGALIGGALGNALGNHTRNSQVGTVVGAVLGGSIAHDIDNNNSRGDEVVRTQTVERCRQVNETRQQEKLVGYDVRYSYNGLEHTVRMDRDPGRTVQIRVSAEPVL